MAKTQTSVVLAHMQEHGSITSMEAFELYGITRLSAKVFALRALGHDIETKRESTRNRFGHKVSYARYTIKEESNED